MFLRSFAEVFFANCGDSRRLSLSPAKRSTNIAEICGDDESAQKLRRIKILARETPQRPASEVCATANPRAKSLEFQSLAKFYASFLPRFPEPYSPEKPRRPSCRLFVKGFQGFYLISDSYPMHTDSYPMPRCGDHVYVAGILAHAHIIQRILKGCFPSATSPTH